MDFHDSPDEAAYRATAATWLAANVPHFADDSERRTLAAAKQWQATKAAAGYACITWPAEWGGQGGTPIENVIFAAEEDRHRVPPNEFEISLGICLPTLLTLSDQATRDRFAAPAMRGEETWCQLLSEPSNGSDLAAARTRAVPADDGSGDWIVNGQKVWTTTAQFADYGIIIARTDPDVPKHAGLTMFWFDMKTRGVVVRPIHQMSDDYEFNEIFLTDVRIPDAQRLGAVNAGWESSLVMLMHERVAIGGPRGHDWPEFMDLARSLPGRDGATALADRAVREKLADWYVQSEGLKNVRNRMLTALSKGELPGPENSMGKIVAGQQIQSMAAAATELLEEYGVIDDPRFMALGSGFHESLLSVPGLRIAGGTDEILKNIIAERMLGLPGDVRLDKGVAFRDIPTGR